MEDGFYHSREWLDLAERVRVRDGHRCTVARLLGGRCSGTLHVHHVIPRSERRDLELDEENCITACASHHPTLEAVRRLIVSILSEDPPRCPHKHPYPEGRRRCEEKRKQERIVRKAARLAA